MKHTEYLEAKASLKQAAMDARKAYPNDKPAIRQYINDIADALIRQFEGKRAALYEKWLSSYACTLHPKD